jgi:hypothetical protein
MDCVECGKKLGFMKFRPMGWTPPNKDAWLCKECAEKHLAKYKAEKGFKEILFTDAKTDEEIKNDIQVDMMNLAMHEAGTAWMRLGTVLSLNSTEQMLGAGFKALIDQNKIIIRQNELILRALQRLLKFTEEGKKE